MIGEKINIDKSFYKPAESILEYLQHLIGNADRFVLSIAGESGSGKTTIALTLADLLKQRGISSNILHMDDYFVLPPFSNDTARRRDITLVGPQEVNLEVLENNLKTFILGGKYIDKPLVNYAANSISSETLNLDDVKVLIVEGTYVSLLKNINTRIFINRNYVDTLEARKMRSRSAHELDPFIDTVLQIEHAIISTHKGKATVLVNKDYSVEFVQ